MERAQLCKLRPQVTTDHVINFKILSACQVFRCVVQKCMCQISNLTPINWSSGKTLNSEWTFYVIKNYGNWKWTNSIYISRSHELSTYSIWSINKNMLYYMYIHRPISLMGLLKVNQLNKYFSISWIIHAAFWFAPLNFREGNLCLRSYFFFLL